MLKTFLTHHLNFPFSPNFLGIQKKLVLAKKRVPRLICLVLEEENPKKIIGDERFPGLTNHAHFHSVFSSKLSQYLHQYIHW